MSKKTKQAPVVEPLAAVESKGMVMTWHDALGHGASPVGAYDDYRRARTDWPISLESWLGAQAIAQGFDCDDRQAIVIAHELRYDYWLNEMYMQAGKPTVLNRMWAMKMAYSFYLSEQQWLEDRAEQDVETA